MRFRIYGRYNVYHYNYQCLKRNKHATKAEKLALLEKVEKLTDRCNDVMFQATVSPRFYHCENSNEWVRR